MALTKISLEIEVEDTFQNGTKLDLDTMYALLNEVAETEYNRQFDANMLQRRFGMSISGNGPATPLNATVSETTEEVESGEVVAPTTEEVTLRRRKRSGLNFEKIESKLFLPGQSQRH